ncbi:MULTISPECIES: stage V sporulation protein AD [Oceanobacillus]|uniref:Stage V sporulation protein AD n=1 Tax=Oceanobacillus kimchii TaxID=746691 RepID=A0ABQ5TI44_9BACI|nr:MULTISPECIES: stage V sporulation protein AD [Oceanobacillus]MBT2598883.1 stage V sporulation protein AD [Oceanobacillus sp. ISL-74]MBT2651802.1 stage V sporulation protein AD [Oceanobacillus sp. ISL-73]MCT1576451.1 stage V sporulation protein AD [Oceanobacillus kimchii]MCT2136087.1 stage V sporulation protein AD [Oceanobacillus kimchii]OEH54495.1 stage V sporulation protein AD [Oceanobacillus sp. E9]
MLIGHRTWQFINRPSIITTGTVGGPFEANGKIPEAFDTLHEDMWINQDSFEKAQQKMLEEACQIAIKKSPIEKENVGFFLGGDLINQITPTSFAAKTVGSPYLGVFSACATSMESLALAATIINSGGADYILTGASSHNAAAEKQFRYPTEYGGQKPPTAQWTVTGAGCALVAKQGNGPYVTSATIGKIVDMGMTDPFNMGGAMAAAAADTIEAHLQDKKIDPSYYDLIITGDLGHIGREVSLDYMHERNIDINPDQYVDCGLTIYREGQPVLAGASGPACSAIVTYGHFLKQMAEGKLKRILIVATGSLHSPLSVNQKDPIPCIAHAVSIESGSDNE